MTRPSRILPGFKSDSAEVLYALLTQKKFRRRSSQISQGAQGVSVSVLSGAGCLALRGFAEFDEGEDLVVVKNAPAVPPSSSASRMNASSLAPKAQEEATRGENAIDVALEIRRLLRRDVQVVVEGVRERLCKVVSLLSEFRDIQKFRRYSLRLPFRLSVKILSFWEYPVHGIWESWRRTALALAGLDFFGRFSLDAFRTSFQVFQTSDRLAGFSNTAIPLVGRLNALRQLPKKIRCLGGKMILPGLKEWDAFEGIGADGEPVIHPEESGFEDFRKEFGRFEGQKQLTFDVASMRRLFGVGKQTKMLTEDCLGSVRRLVLSDAKIRVNRWVSIGVSDILVVAKVIGKRLKTLTIENESGEDIPLRFGLFSMLRNLRVQHLSSRMSLAGMLQLETLVLGPAHIRHFPDRVEVLSLVQISEVMQLPKLRVLIIGASGSGRQTTFYDATLPTGWAELFCHASLRELQIFHNLLPEVAADVRERLAALDTPLDYILPRAVAEDFIPLESGLRKLVVGRIPFKVFDELTRLVTLEHLRATIEPVLADFPGPSASSGAEEYYFISDLDWDVLNRLLRLEVLDLSLSLKGPLLGCVRRPMQYEREVLELPKLVELRLNGFGDLVVFVVVPSVMMALSKLDYSTYSEDIPFKHAAKELLASVLTCPLREISVYGSILISDSIFCSLVRMPTLRVLTMRDVRLREEPLSKLLVLPSDATSLQSLTLTGDSESTLSRRIFESLSVLSKLEDIRIAVKPNYQYGRVKDQYGALKGAKAVIDFLVENITGFPRLRKVSAWYSGYNIPAKLREEHVILAAVLSQCAPSSRDEVGISLLPETGLAVLDLVATEIIAESSRFQPKFVQDCIRECGEVLNEPWWRDRCFFSSLPQDLVRRILFDYVQCPQGAWGEHEALRLFFGRFMDDPSREIVQLYSHVHCYQTPLLSSPLILKSLQWVFQLSSVVVAPIDRVISVRELKLQGRLVGDQLLEVGFVEAHRPRVYFKDVRKLVVKCCCNPEEVLTETGLIDAPSLVEVTFDGCHLQQTEFVASSCEWPSLARLRIVQEEQPADLSLLKIKFPFAECVQEM